MKRTRIQRLVALILCLTFAISGFAISAAAADDESSSTEGSNGSIYDSSEILELLNSISYGDYLKDANAKPAKDEIKAAGKRITGITIPVSVPYAASESSRDEPFFRSPAGISACSTVKSPDLA